MKRPSISPYPEYAGSLNRKTMSKDARHAYESYCGQVRKCKNPKNEWFKYYGGKGISVEYTPKQFIGWWLESLKGFSGKTPTVGRLDHDKNYCFDNISMQDMADNSREAVLRNGLNKPENQKTSTPVKVTNINTGESTICPSIRSAAKQFGLEQATVQRLCKGKIKKLRDKPLTCSFLGAA